MFERYATGRYSLKEIAKLARADGLVYRKSGNPVPTSTVHRILRNRTYTGEFIYNDEFYRGAYLPIVSVELWEQVQAVLEGRHLKRPKKRTHNFAFSGLISCGHCGHALVGDMKKGRYVYYHCTGHGVKCRQPYIREEILEAQFTRLLQGIAFPEEVLTWVRQALRESLRDEKRFREEAIARLRREHKRLQDRIETMYVDKLDGRVEAEFFDRKAAEFRTEQVRILRDLEAHQAADQSYIEEGVRLLELAQRAHQLFESQPPAEKRSLLNFVLSNYRLPGRRDYRKLPALDQQRGQTVIPD